MTVTAYDRSEPITGGPPAAGVDDDGRDLLARLLDDPDPQVRAACQAAVLWLPTDPIHRDW